MEEQTTPPIPAELTENTALENQSPSAKELVAKNLLAQSGIKAEGLDANKARRIIDEASNRLAKQMGMEQATALRVLLACALVDSANPNMIACESLGPKGLPQASPDANRLNQYINDVSNVLIPGPLSKLGVFNLRVLVGASITSPDKNLVVDTLLHGSSLKREQLNPDRAVQVSVDASNRLAKGQLGYHGTTSVRSLVAASVASTR